MFHSSLVVLDSTRGVSFAVVSRRTNQNILRRQGRKGKFWTLVSFLGLSANGSKTF